MVVSQEKDKENHNMYIELYRRYEVLDNGLRAALRRVSEPEDIRDTVALYRLFYKARPDEGWLRVVFLLPWCTQCRVGAENTTPAFGAQMAGKVNEMRILQVAHAKEPFDIVQLRRLAMQVKPIIDWARFGGTLFYWTHEAKRRIVEDFYYPEPKYSMKGAKS
jgi:CRISPR type I-E-associated protein CasB/Cse2